MLPTTEFIHVPSTENLADLSSRGLLAMQLVAQQKCWFQGPSWLESSLPVQPHSLLTKEESRQEVNSLTVINSPSSLLVCLDNLNSQVRVLRTLCFCKVSLKKISWQPLVGRKWLSPQMLWSKQIRWRTLSRIPSHLKW